MDFGKRSQGGIEGLRIGKAALGLGDSGAAGERLCSDIRRLPRHGFSFTSFHHHGRHVGIDCFIFVVNWYIFGWLCRFSYDDCFNDNFELCLSSAIKEFM